MTARCELALMLRTGGPVRASMRMCCLLALVGRERPTDPEALRQGSYVCLAEEAGDVAPRPARSGAAT